MTTRHDVSWVRLEIARQGGLPAGAQQRYDLARITWDILEASKTAHSHWLRPGKRCEGHTLVAPTATG